MNTFTRMDKKDFERLTEHDRWSAGSVANLVINAQMELDGSFNKHYWRDDAQQRFRDLLEVTFFDWYNAGVLKFYGPEGDLGKSLNCESQVLRAYGDQCAVATEDVFFLKKGGYPPT